VAKTKDLKIVTSSWSTNQYAEELSFRYADDNAGPIILELINRLLNRWKEELEPVEKLIEIRLTDDLLDASLAYIKYEKLTAEQAIHVYSAKVGKCDSFVIADKNFHLDRNVWKQEFEIYYLDSEEDRAKLSKEIESL
jgi:hypothetical protein